MNPYLLIPAVVALLAALGWAGNADVADATDHEALHCEMVQLYEETNGKQGWPDYDPTIKCS